MKPLIFFTMLFLLGCENKECLKSHLETRHKNSWTQFLFVGKTMIPIIHPARDYKIQICDEYKEQDDKR